MKRREWLVRALLGVEALLLASCGGDGDDERSSTGDTAPGNGTSGETAVEPGVIRLASMEHPNQFNPLKPSVLARDLVEGWSSGSIPGALENSELQTVDIPIPIDENGVWQTALGVYDFLTSSAAGGVSAAEVVWLPAYADVYSLFGSGLFAPLDRWLQASKESALDAFAEEARPLVRLRGETWGLPLAIAPGVLSHNLSRFRLANVDPPTAEWTWQDFIEAGKRLTEDTNDDGTPDRWGFIGNRYFPDWLPFLLQEGGQVVDLDTGKIGLEDSASVRALNAWEELGRVHGILPYGADVTEEELWGWANLPRSGMQFTAFEKNLREGWTNVTPMPQGRAKTTPLSLEEVLMVPADAADENAFAALGALAQWIGERRVLPAVTAGWQYLEQADTSHFDLIFPSPMKETALQSLANGKASHAASDSAISYHLFHQVTLPLARGEVGVEQAIDQAQNWLQSYIAE